MLNKIYWWLFNKIYEGSHGRFRFYRGWIIIEPRGKWYYFAEHESERFIALYQYDRSVNHAKHSTVLRVEGDAYEVTKNLQLLEKETKNDS